MLIILFSTELDGEFNIWVISQKAEDQHIFISYILDIMTPKYPQNSELPSQIHINSFWI
jgi:hypothetical protein